LWAALLFAIMMSGWRALTLYSRNLSVFVRVSMKSADVGTAVLYYDVGRQFNNKHVSTSPVYGDGKFHDVKLKIPFNKAFYHLRFDPPSTSEGEIVVNKVDIVDRYGRILYDFNLSLLKPANQIKKFDFINGNIHFSTDEKANDPQINILVDRPITFNRLQLLALMLTHQVIPEFICLFLICVLLIYVWSRWTDPVIATMVILAIIAAGWMLYNDYNSAYFRLSMKTAVKGEMVELYYDQGYGLSYEDVVAAHVHGDDLFHEYILKIPRGISHLRFDPFMTAGTAVIKKVGITDRFGNPLKSFTLQQMSPAWEIKRFELLDEGVKVTTEDKAVDPQININIDEAWIQHSHPLSLLFVMTTLIEWSLIFALLMFSIYIWKRHKEKMYHFIDGNFFQEKLPVLYLGCALGLILAMAVISGPDVHPDEIGHEHAASYYSDSWLPPSIDDPRMVKTISGFGVSYLFRLDIVYFLSGKVALLLSELVNDNNLRLRLFNVLLFFILILIVTCKIRSAPLFILALVLSPQIWYLFSYFNGDGFAFFIAILIAMQLIYPDSLTNQYLNSVTLRDKVSGGVLFGILVSMLLISKPNYYVYLAFILLIVGWNLFFERGFANWGENRLQIKKGVLITCVALCIYLPLVVYDQYINDFKKDEKISNFVDKHAVYQFKASTVMNAPDDSYPGMSLKFKGVSWQELFLEKSYWRKLSFLSFFGVYGYMNLYADSNYYEMLSIFLFGMVLFIYFYAAYTITPKDGIVLCIVLIFLLLAIGQSTYVSWAADFEPQGRYLFPIIPILLLGLSRLSVVFQKRMIPCFSLILLMFNLTSFVFYALLFIPKIM
ncbi:MAG: hypothetical protein C0403_15415, partial [Desulfobacterium sp.]|nr:hypothetical protein [Desulfobacterium sp.]